MSVFQNLVDSVSGTCLKSEMNCFQFCEAGLALHVGNTCPNLPHFQKSLPSVYFGKEKVKYLSLLHCSTGIPTQGCTLCASAHSSIQDRHSLCSWPLPITPGFNVLKIQLPSTVPTEEWVTHWSGLNHRNILNCKGGLKIGFKWGTICLVKIQDSITKRSGEWILVDHQQFLPQNYFKKRYFEQKEGSQAQKRKVQKVMKWQSHLSSIKNKMYPIRGMCLSVRQIDLYCEDGHSRLSKPKLSNHVINFLCSNSMLTEKSFLAQRESMCSRSQRKHWFT